MRPQDVVVLLKIIALDGATWRYADLSRTLFISQSEVAEALQRCKQARLVDASKRKVYRSAFYEFLVHGLKYVFPVSPGSLVRGVPTAFPPQSQTEEFEAEFPYVWPSAEGTARGQAIEPLYRNIPKAAAMDAQLYELLALTDLIRVGRARETLEASEALEQRIKWMNHA